MEILIKLDERLYEYAKSHALTPSEIDEICDVIANGIPLPEGHGDLIDRSEISMPYDICDGDEAISFVNEVSPIIEATKE